MDLKAQAASRALEYVQSGMRLGLGTGSTATHFVQQLGERLRSGALSDIAGVPTSADTAKLAASLGIPLTTLSALAEKQFPPVLDLAIDGADEVDPDLNLIKGLGRAALGEKIVETHARRFVVVVDESKLVERLGRGPLPVEVTQFEAELHVRWLASLGCQAELWRDEAGQPYLTDNGNWLARCWFSGGIQDPPALAAALDAHPGILGHGLFLGMASEVIVAGSNGIEVMNKQGRR